MAAGILSGLFQRAPRRDQVIAIDLGSRVTKAVALRRQESIVYLTGYGCVDALTGDKRKSPEAWKEHFAAVVKGLGGRTNSAVLILSSDESRLSHAEVTAAGVSDLRRSMRLSSKLYFQEDLADHVFDCQILPAVKSARPQVDETAEVEAVEGSDVNRVAKTAAASLGGGSRGATKVPALVAAARRQWVEQLQAAAAAAGLVVESVALGQICGAQVFRWMPTSMQKESVALVDIGFHRSVITILVSGIPVLSRVVNIGGDRFTSGLAETLNITYSVAEGIKQVMPEKVQSKLQVLISPLAQELRASIDFVEKEYDKSVTDVYVSGSSARSNSIIHLLETETIVPCRAWSPEAAVTADLANGAAADLGKMAPQLVDAIGGGLAWLHPETAQLNLLAEEIEAKEERRRDPVRRAVWVGVLVILGMLGWVITSGWRFWRTNQEVAQAEDRLASLVKVSTEVTRFSREAREVDRVMANLRQVTSNRFLAATALNALQFCAVDRVEATRIKLQRALAITPGTKTTTNELGRITLGRPDIGTERVVLSIQAKDFGAPAQADMFIETIASHEYFVSHLRPRESIRLVERSPRQVDPLNPSRSFILFTIECYYSERQFRGE